MINNKDFKFYYYYYYNLYNKIKKYIYFKFINI